MKDDHKPYPFDPKLQCVVQDLKDPATDLSVETESGDDESPC